MNIVRYVSVVGMLAGCALAQNTASWTRKSTPISPAARSEYGLAYDSAHGQTVLYGGIDDVSGLPLGDTWLWDGAAWTRANPANSPGGRFRHSMVYDSARGQTVLFGGTTVFSGSYVDINDTWVWDGTNWTAMNPTNFPGALEGQNMAYDAARGKTILFGGIAGNLISNCVVTMPDTWQWDGNNWTKLAVANPPNGRFQAAFAYDSVRRQIVMFGGGVNQCNGQAATAVNETWTWDGVKWTQQSPKTSPAARMAVAMAEDAGGGRLMLFGGLSPRPIVAAFNDTWAWDGTNWAQQTASGPSARYLHSLAYDAARRQVLLFGGVAINSVAPDLADTWTLDSSGGGSAPSVSNVISAGGFGAFPAAAAGSWIEIYGANLATTTRLWNGSDFTGVNAPTTLDGVQVTVGGQKAYIDYVAVSPGQINAQLPSNLATGTQQLVVSNGGVLSAPVNLTINATQPGLLAPASFVVGGKQYVVAQSVDGTYILPTGAIPGVTSRPARPGETITIYGVGFGAVTPSTPSGQIVVQNNQLTAPLQIQFGSATATTSYAGLAPQYLGLYLFNVVVPPVSDNSLVPLTFTLGGAPGSQTLYTAVHQ